MDQWQARLGTLIRKYRGDMPQVVLAELVSEASGRKVRQNHVSDHEHGRRWAADFDLMHAYAEVLHIPVRELHDAVGIPKEDEEEPRPRTFAEIVSQDETLSKVAKNHLLNQYELLQMATEHERAGKPVLHEDKKQPRRKQA
jgi:hypothetical protein